MKVLIVIDMQEDFVNGVLGTPQARAIVPKVAAKVKEYTNSKEETVIIYTSGTINQPLVLTMQWGTGRYLPSIVFM